MTYENFCHWLAGYLDGLSSLEGITPSQRGKMRSILNETLEQEKSDGKSDIS